MVKYCYYDPDTMQIMSVYETPFLADQTGEDGRTRAVLPDVLGEVGRDHKISVVSNGEVGAVVDSVNSVQPQPRRRTRLDDLRDILQADTITDVEIREMLRLERGL